MKFQNFKNTESWSHILNWEIEILDRIYKPVLRSAVNLSNVLRKTLTDSIFCRVVPDIWPFFISGIRPDIQLHLPEIQITGYPV